MAGVPGWRPVPAGVHRGLVAEARGVLAGAWLAYYQEDYRWTIVRAWTGAAWATTSYSPGRSTPLGLRVQMSGCGALEAYSHEAAILDSLYLAFSDPWIAVILGDLARPSKADALRALEAAVKLLDAASTCGPGEPRMAAPPRIDYGVRIGDVLVVVDESVSGVPLGERIREGAERLVPGLYTLILAPEEAGLYFEAPWAKYMALLGEAEALGNDPVTLMLARRLEPGWY